MENHRVQDGADMGVCLHELAPVNWRDATTGHGMLTRQRCKDVALPVGNLEPVSIFFNLKGAGCLPLNDKGIIACVFVKIVPAHPIHVVHVRLGVHRYFSWTKLHIRTEVFKRRGDNLKLPSPEALP